MYFVSLSLGWLTYKSKYQYQRDHLVGQSTNNGEDHGDGDGGGDYHQPGRSLITAIAEHQDLRATVVNRPG